MSDHLDEKCLFCDIVKGTIPSFKILETEYSLAFLDIAPFSDGHTQIISKYHANTILELPDEYLRDVGPLLKKVAKATGVGAFNVLQNNGELAYQHVPHVHFHIIPKPNEHEGLVATEETMKKKTVTKEELAKVAEEMKARLAGSASENIGLANK